MDNAPFKESSSELRSQSPLIQLFVKRTGTSESGENAMRAAVAHLRRSYRGEESVDQRTTVYLKKRGIKHLDIVQDMNCDGVLKPIGPIYADGFKILLRRQSSHARLRFTIAHEICHTFFYQFVPELKFTPHEVDRNEERLCDFGAAELLMPAASIQKAALGLSVCIESLRRLAVHYSVSVTAMFLRLRSLRLWNCVFSEWHRMVNGTFILANCYGGKAVPWEWEDESILDEAWQSNKASRGHTFVRYQNERGTRYYCPTRFEVRRFGNRIISLWGSEITNPLPVYPLFEASRS